MLVACAVLGFAAAAGAQTPTRIRGTIEAVNGRTLAIDTREGKKISVQVPEPVTVMAVKRADRSSISPGAFVGIAAEPDAQGKLKAQEVLVFPENMRGTGEGQYGWDLTPKSNMTNGTVKAAKQGGGEQYLELTYKNAEANITVPPDVPVVTLVPAEWSDLKPGEKVFLGATKKPDGEFTASRIIVGKNGVAPPM
ncbi:MAG: hypothetical protein J0H14_23420 [Alphaproteobacteria bacterium]|nr:hypothetical protein [Alphaproteobacteria bacterium]